MDDFFYNNLKEKYISAIPKSFQSVNVKYDKIIPGS